MKDKNKLPSNMTENDSSVLEEIEIIEDLSVLGEIEIISDSDETFSQTCARHGGLYEEEDTTPVHYLEDYMTSVQIAFQSFCEDNPKITKEEFTNWYQNLIDDEELFRLDKHTDVLWKDVRTVFDAKMDVNDNAKVYQQIIQ